MSSVAELDRIQGLVAGLKALGNVQRGDVIRAQQWNDLVSIVTSVVQSLLAAQPQAVPPHEHPDQVKLSWLDPNVRGLVEKGSLSDPASVSRFIELSDRVSRLEKQVEALRGDTSHVRDRFAELSTRELVRDANIHETRRLVEVIDRREDAVTELRKSLDSIQGKVDLAVRASSSLTVGGQPVDMEKLEQRIRGVEELKTSVTTRVDAFETRITDIHKVTVTQAQLDEALKKHKANLPADVVTGIRDTVTTQLRNELTTSLGTVRGEVTAEVDRKLAAVDATVVQRIDERVPAAVGAEVAGVKAQIVKTAEELRSEAKTAADKSASGAASTVREELTKLIANVQAGVVPAVRKELDVQLPARFTEVQTAVAAAQKNADTALTRVNAQAAELQSARARAEQIALQSDSAVKAAQAALLEEIGRRETAGKVALDKRFVDFEGKVDARIDTRVGPRLNDFRTELAATMQTTATTAATAAVKAERVQISAEMTKIARDQSLALKDQVVAQVRADVEPVIKQSVASEVKLSGVAIKPIILPGGGGGRP